MNSRQRRKAKRSVIKKQRDQVKKELRQKGYSGKELLKVLENR